MKKYIKFIFIFVIFLFISLGTIFYVKADSGWDSDYGGGSSWSSSSSDSSYDRSSSWSSSDYSSSYDNDDNRSSYGHNSKNNTKFSKGTIIFWFIVLVFAFGLVVCIVFLPLFLPLIFKNKKNDSSNLTYDPYRDLNESNYYIYFKMYKDEFKNIISKKFIDVQESWMNFDYDSLRKLCTDELYNQYKTLLETLKLKNEQNIMSDFNINSVSVYKVEEVNKLMEVSVLLDITFRDYVINTKNNQVVRGSKNILFNNTYELTFITNKNNVIDKCPSCGAKVNVKSSEVCEYCHNTIVQISDELVLSKKKIISSNKSKG